MNDLTPVPEDLFEDVRALIVQARQRTATTVNAELTLLYWRVGKRINDEILRGERADYGKQIIGKLADRLTLVIGKGWSARQLRYCVQLTIAFPDLSIVNALCAKLSWSHLRLLVSLEDPLKRDFYVEMCRLEGWSTRQLNERMKSMLYERTAISRKPAQTVQTDLANLRDEGQLSADLAFRDPYVLDFLGLADTYSERDLESSILAELQRFIIELGTDFAFVARQKRITIDDRDYYLDLLFFHRRLRRLVVIDLKIGEFEAAFKGQMELYLRYLEKHEMVEGEETPIGLILCSGKNEDHVELLRLDQSNIRVAEYLTELPSREVLQDKLHKSIEIARQRLSAQENSGE